MWFRKEWYFAWPLAVGWLKRETAKKEFVFSRNYISWILPKFLNYFCHFRAKNQMSWPKMILMLHEETSLFLKWCKQFILFGRFVGNLQEISKTKQHCLQFISKYIHTNILYLSFNWGVAGGDWTLDTIIHT